MSETLTISQALRRIKKLKGQLAEQRARAANSVSYKTTERPAFDFSSSVEAANVARKELVALQAAVSVANAETSVEWEGQTIRLCHATRLLDEYKSEIAWLRTLAVKSQSEVMEHEIEYDDEARKHVRRDVPWKCALPEAKRAGEVERVQGLFDKLNDAVETTNHKTKVTI